MHRYPINDRGKSRKTASQYYSLPCRYNINSSFVCVNDIKREQTGPEEPIRGFVDSC